MSRVTDAVNIGKNTLYLMPSMQPKNLQYSNMPALAQSCQQAVRNYGTSINIRQKIRNRGTAEANDNAPNVS